MRSSSNVLLSGQTITNPTFTGTIKGVPFKIANASIPFVSLSSGSVSAAGAITGITALPLAYPNAYCYFPANILATVKAAGWYYCTFSTTTAGTAFLNAYTGGAPTVPASPTAVTDGKGAFTGDTGEETLSFTIPGGSLGPNGGIRVTTFGSSTNSGGTKIYRVRYNGVSGTIYASCQITTQLAMWQDAWIGNAGVTGVQHGSSKALNGGGTYAMQTLLNSSADSTADTALVLSNQRNTATDNQVLEFFTIEAFYGA